LVALPTSTFRPASSMQRWAAFPWRPIQT
jgi:hypothetical protein